MFIFKLKPVKRKKGFITMYVLIIGCICIFMSITCFCMQISIKEYNEIFKLNMIGNKNKDEEKEYLVYILKNYINKHKQENVNLEKFIEDNVETINNYNINYNEVYLKIDKVEVSEKTRGKYSYRILFIYKVNGVIRKDFYSFKEDNGKLKLLYLSSM